MKGEGHSLGECLEVHYPAMAQRKVFLGLNTLNEIRSIPIVLDAQANKTRRHEKPILTGDTCGCSGTSPWTAEQKRATRLI